MEKDKINAFPRKKLFIEILTQDVSVKTCILDLIDNSVDSYTRHEIQDKRKIEITIKKDEFEIYDTCGGIEKEFLKEHVFRFGAENLNRKNPTLGMYGIGLKRSIFKLGNNISLETDDGKNYSLMELNVERWEKKDENDWEIPFDTDNSSLKGTQKPYTRIKIKELHPEINNKFSLDTFINDLLETIKRVYCLIIQNQIEFTYNGETIEPYPLLVPQDEDYSPSVRIETYDDISIHIICFIDPSKGTRLNNAINQVGWNLFCNNRLILANDITEATGWIGSRGNRDRSVLPKYHSIYNEFRGIVFLNSNNPFKLPLDTSKSKLVTENKNYQYILKKMIKTARPVIDYLTAKYNKEKEQEDAIEEQIEQNIDQTYDPKNLINATDLKDVSIFKAPSRSEKPTTIKQVKISFSKEKKIVDKVKKYLNVSTNKEVGERTFDYFVEMEDIDNG